MSSFVSGTSLSKTLSFLVSRSSTGRWLEVEEKRAALRLQVSGLILFNQLIFGVLRGVFCFPRLNHIYFLLWKYYLFCHFSYKDAVGPSLEISLRADRSRGVG